MKQGKIKSADDIRRALHTYPMKVPDDKDIRIDNGVIEVTDAPTGCMLIKRSVIEKMIEKYDLDNSSNILFEFPRSTTKISSTYRMRTSAR